MAAHQANFAATSAMMIVVLVCPYGLSCPTAYYILNESLEKLPLATNQQSTDYHSRSQVVATTGLKGVTRSVAMSVSIATPITLPQD